MTGQGPKISVISVSFNAGRDLALTVESVLAQTWSNLEYIVVDGMSWDQSYDVLARYRERIDRIVSIEDSGVYDAMNKAIAWASGEYVLFMNAGDCFHDADAIEAIFSRLNENVDVVYGDHIYVSGRRERFQSAGDFEWLWEQLRSGCVDENWHRNIPCHQATFARTAALRAMPYDTRYRICADHDWLWRAHAAGMRLRYVDEIVARYTAGGMSDDKSKRIIIEWADCYRRFSDRPARIDGFLFGSATLSPWYKQDNQRYDPAGYCSPPILTDNAIKICESALPVLRYTLVDGWSVPECQIGLVWSIVEEALLLLDFSKRPKKLLFFCNGNPHVSGGQQLTILVNSEKAGTFSLYAQQEPTTCKIDVGKYWQEGANVISLKVDKQAYAPGDTRYLGLALYGLTWV